MCADYTAITALHKRHHDDYEEAKEQIRKALGDISAIEVFGSQVLVAAYVRPNKTTTGLYLSVKMQTEDIWQGKAVLVLKLGPSAYDGDDSYLRAIFGDRNPLAPGDWVFVRAADGHPMSLIGDGGERVMAKDHRGGEVPIFDWDGWPCRVVPAESIIGRINKPHSIV